MKVPPLRGSGFGGALTPGSASLHQGLLMVPSLRDWKEFTHKPHEGLAQNNVRSQFFVHGKHGRRGKFCRVVALTDEPALPKFLCAKVGFAQLRRRHPTPEAWHHE
jgi:hypothetical protein